MSILMEVKGLILDPIANMPVVILRSEGGDFLPIWVGDFEANAIALQMEGITTPRPMTHDLLRNLIGKLEGEVLKVVISDLVENTFYAEVHLSFHGKELVLDSRPSDAIALALRTSASVFVEADVLTKSRANDDPSEARSSERLKNWLEQVDPDSLGKYRM